MVQNASVFDILTWKCASRHSSVPFFDNCSTSELQKVVRTPHVFKILTSKRASRHSGVQIFHSPTSKNAPTVRYFVHFGLQMCFAPQRRAFFRHRNLQKCSGNGVFCTFWLANVLRTTAACHFSTSQLAKVLREWCVLHILTCKCPSRHNGVPFFLSALTSYLRTRRFSEPTFRPSRHTNHRKNAVFRDFPNISRMLIFFLRTFAQL